MLADIETFHFLFRRHAYTDGRSDNLPEDQRNDEDKGADANNANQLLDQ